jgi:hypothetical protein
LIPPVKPFDSYKWRWAEYTPAESLNLPPVFLGVLRALRHFEGRPPSDSELAVVLDRVERETKSPVNLGHLKDTDRNLIRYFGRYWKALGLLESTQPIELTAFGRRVADGLITQDEFVATVIKTLQLPNTYIEADISEWEAANLTIHPLGLILEILKALATRMGSDQAFLTPEELVLVVIPLAGTEAPIGEYIDSLGKYRQGILDLNDWPNCAPGANDRRMAHEFLRFLANYKVLEKTGESFGGATYQLPEASISIVDSFGAVQVPSNSEGALAEIRSKDASMIVPRESILSRVKARPQQTRFRRDVLLAHRNKCLLTEETIPDALEASHLIPVEEGGSDEAGNGICLRADIHRLFDAGHIKIALDGTIHRSERLSESRTYSQLPDRIILPRCIDLACLEWRWKYE